MQLKANIKHLPDFNDLRNSNSILDLYQLTVYIGHISGSFPNHFWILALDEQFRLQFWLIVLIWIRCQSFDLESGLDHWLTNLLTLVIDIVKKIWV